MAPSDAIIYLEGKSDNSRDCERSISSGLFTRETRRDPRKLPIINLRTRQRYKMMKIIEREAFLSF